MILYFVILNKQSRPFLKIFDQKGSKILNRENTFTSQFVEKSHFSIKTLFTIKCDYNNSKNIQKCSKHFFFKINVCKTRQIISFYFLLMISQNHN